MMDAAFTAALRLWEQDLSQKEIARRLNISEQKVRRILVTAGAIQTEESKLHAQGQTVEEIAAALGKTVKAVQTRIPYDKGMYNSEYPTINALRIRKTRKKVEAKKR